MITIDFLHKGKRYGIKARGHAGYGPHGQDIVCAAVSALLQTYGNYIDELDHKKKVEILELKYDEGDINIECIDTSERCKDIFYMVEMGIEDIEKIYPAYIKINYNPTA